MALLVTSFEVCALPGNSVTFLLMKLHLINSISSKQQINCYNLPCFIVQMAFSLDELKAEVLNRQLWGLTAAMLIVPTIVLESSDAPVLNTVSDDQYESSLQGRWEQNLRRMKTSIDFRERFLGVFDDIITSGILPTDK